ncbi:MAG TPA: PASTA domain-containing protein [Gaiellaceae bacterium]
MNVGRTIIGTIAALAAVATLGTAEATPPPGHTLTVTKAGTGTGTIVTSPAGIDCGADCSAVFPSGTSVTVRAVNGYRSRFAGWSGDCSGTTTCVVTMTGEHRVQARFASAGAAGCKVPKVAGLTFAKAKIRIVLARCKVGKLTRKFSKRRQKGRVIAQRPRAGTRLKTGGKVSLTLGKGPKPRR